MPKTDTSTAAPVTAAATFHSCNPAHQHLFAVRPGVSVADALEIASSLLASALSAVHSAASEHDDEILFGAIFQLEARPNDLLGARLLIEHRRDDAQAERVLAALRKRFPDHPAAAEAQQLQALITRLRAAGATSH